MAFIPQNFVDKSLPAVKAVWLNAVDVFINSLFAAATTTAQALAALNINLDVTNLINSLLGGPRTQAEITAGVTPTSYRYATLTPPRYMTPTQVADWLAGTGLVDQSSALNTMHTVAMATSPHGKMYVPGGKYLIASPGIAWTDQNDISFEGDGPNLTSFLITGSNYTPLSISADTGGGTTGTNLVLKNFGIGVVGSLGTNINALYLADYFGFNLENLQLYSSGDSLKMAGMAVGVVTNCNGLTAGTNGAGNSGLKLTTDTAGVGCGPITFNGGNFNGQDNVTQGGAVWTKLANSIVFNSPIFVAFGPSLTSVVAATNNDDITINEGYAESCRNTTANTAAMFDLGATVAPQNFRLQGGTYFMSAGGHTCAYGVLGHAVQAFTVDGTTFALAATSAIKYTTSLASMIELRNVYSQGGAPVLDSSIVGAPQSGYLKSWSDPWPRLDASLVAGVSNATGNGAVYTVLFDTANFDFTGMYAPGTGIATIPTQSPGLYDVAATLLLNSLGAANTGLEMDIVQKTSGGTVVSTHAFNINPGAIRNAGNQCSVTQNCLLNCKSGDQVYVTVTVTGGAGNTVGLVGSATEYTRLSLRYLG